MTAGLALNLNQLSFSGHNNDITTGLVLNLNQMSFSGHNNDMTTRLSSRGLLSIAHPLRTGNLKRFTTVDVAIGQCIIARGTSSLRDDYFTYREF